MKTLAIVEARLESPQLRSTLTRKLGSHSVLELVVRRVTDCERLDGVIVVAGETPADDGLVHELVPPDVPVFVSPQRDPLGRFVAALDAYRADAVVRVCSLSPFIEPVFIDRLVTTAIEHPSYDYIGYRSRSGQPAISSSLGLFAEWCRADALRRVEREAFLTAERQNVTSYVYSHPEEFKLRLIPVPPDLDRDDLRLTIELEEDFEHVQAIFEALGHDELDWRGIAGLLKQQPGLRQRMAALNRDGA